ncbi:MAG: hypothetical protein FWH11_11645 [Micrococcales bacterium]|nr:hypothetical protein [Micrococcales bacterium]
MTAPAPGTSARLLIVGGASAGVGLLIKLILPLTYGRFDDGNYDPWEAKRFGTGVIAFLGGLTDFALILGAVAIALAFAVRGFEPKVPRPVAPQGYPQGQYAAQPGQYAQPQPGQFGQPVPPDQFSQPAAPPDQGGYTQQQWGGPGS